MSSNSDCPSLDSAPWLKPSDYPSSLNLSGRIINCTTQLPNQIYKDSHGNWDVKPLRGSSALYASNKFLSEETEWETHHVAWTGEIQSSNDLSEKLERIKMKRSNTTDEDPLYLTNDDKQRVTKLLREHNNNQEIHPIWLLRKDQSKWRKYAENVIWPVFHYMMNEPSDGKEEALWWHDYVKFNEAYAAKIKSFVKPGDIIWIHDYYLLLLPQILRMECSGIYICHFLHVPFPSSEYFRCLSKRKILLDGMLAANQIGFQSYSFARHFISCCSRVNGYETTPTSVNFHSYETNIVTIPLGIDVSSFKHDAYTPQVETKMKLLKELNQNRKIIIGRDRLDLVRGVVQKLQAFEMFLAMYPEWIGKLVLIQVSFKPFYHSTKLEKKVNELIAKINAKYGSLDYSPVLHYNMRIEKDEYLALLRVADLCLITSIRDGMNTTALEYIICQDHKCSPLILSEFSGTTTVLQEAIQINPWDSVGVASTINDCLHMPLIKKQNIESKLYDAVAKNTNQNWTCKVLSNLLDFISTKTSFDGTPYLNKPLLLKNYENANHRMFLFDYDGTLTPIVRDPNAAIPSAKLYNILKELSADPKNEIWIISGRDQEFLEKWIGSKFPNIGLSAEHGCFMKRLGSKSWINLTESFDMSWQYEVEKIFAKYTEKTPGSFTEKKKVALTWHYRKSDPEFGIFQAEKCKAELISNLGHYDVEVMSGKANLEVRPKFVNKGEIVRRLITCSNVITQEPRLVEDSPDFAFCLGDDTTDEDMFRALNTIENEWDLNDMPKNKFGGYGFYPVTVGPANKVTVAKAYLSDPFQVLDTLGLLLGKVSLFETAGTVELDDRGHLKDSKSAKDSELNRIRYHKNNSFTS